jgi:hypothetical protein
MAFRKGRTARKKDLPANAKDDRTSYRFFLVVPNHYRTPLVEELERQLGPFGDDLGDHGTVVRAFESAESPAADGVMGNPGWPDRMRRRFAREYDPFMLVIGVDLDGFRPDEDRWSILWFSDYRHEPAVIYRLFAHLARVARSGDDIHDYLTMLSKKKRLDRHLGAVSFKPTVAGISIDMSKDQLDVLDPDA